MQGQGSVQSRERQRVRACSAHHLPPPQKPSCASCWERPHPPRRAASSTSLTGDRGAAARARRATTAAREEAARNTSVVDACNRCATDRETLNERASKTQVVPVILISRIPPSPASLCARAAVSISSSLSSGRHAATRQSPGPQRSLSCASPPPWARPWAVSAGSSRGRSQPLATTMEWPCVREHLRLLLGVVVARHLEAEDRLVVRVGQRA